jgi:hypothetical protein
LALFTECIGTWHYSLTNKWLSLIFLKSNMANEHRIHHSNKYSVTQ